MITQHLRCAADFELRWLVGLFARWNKIYQDKVKDSLEQDIKTKAKTRRNKMSRQS